MNSNETNEHFFEICRNHENLIVNNPSKISIIGIVKICRSYPIKKFKISQINIKINSAKTKLAIGPAATIKDLWYNGFKIKSFF